MGNPIVKLADHYIVWSTISDSPVSFGMTRDELEEYMREEYSAVGLRDLPRRLARVDATGSSSLISKTADETIHSNRAGPRETRLHREEIVEFFVRRKTVPTRGALAEFREGLPRCGPKCREIPDAHGFSNWCMACWGTDFVRAETR